ncbi:MAG: TetR/AcrR family transcriptional regulator [Kiritimatiellaeota bacterium]|nr:TetR/AcrR family transcriptional regulator [Kiritimatiellota bacterium]
MTDEKTNTRDRLLAVASDMFAALGYSQTRTQDICREAGTNPAAVNYHFGGKDGLYKAVWEYALTVAVGEAEAKAISHNEDREWLYHFIYASILAVFDIGPKTNFRKLMQHELRNASGMADDIMERHMSPRMIEMEKRMRRIMGSSVSDFQVRCALAAIYSQCTALNLSRHLSRRLFGDAPPTDEDARRFAREMCAFIIGGVRAIKAAKPDSLA